MRYKDFENTMSTARMSRYLSACNGSTKQAMTLYRKNLQLSQELFTVISCFEVALRNAIDNNYTQTLGANWLRDAAGQGGIFDTNRCRVACNTIRAELTALGNYYTHPKLVAQLGFGFWRYLFSTHQYRAGGQRLLSIFSARPQSTSTIQYNASYIFNELARVNHLRNRIAHHEPICFITNAGITTKSTIYARQQYNLLLQLFQWMQIDERALLYGLDHINTICRQIDGL